MTDSTLQIEMYSLVALQARLANDYDVAHGAMLTGPELDLVEEIARRWARYMEQRMLYG